MKKIYFIFILMLLGITNSMLAQNHAIDLGGTANYVSIPDSYYLSSNAFTIEFDFYMNSLQDTNGGVSSTNSNIPNPVDFYVESSGQSKLVIGNGTNFSFIHNSYMPILSAGQWYHIAIVVNFDSPTIPLVRFYLNGNQLSNTFVGLNTQYIPNNSILIGDRMDGLTNANAKFDNVRIWSVARTAAEIQNNYNSCLTGNETGLDIYYTFENISGNTVTDVAGINGAQNGTIVGTATTAMGTNCIPTIPAPPTTNYTTQIFTGNDKTLVDLQVTGSNIKWYNSSTNGSLLPINTTLVDGGIYYATQTVTGLESTNRLPIKVKKISENVQTIAPSSTVANLVAQTSSGGTAQWFTTASGGTPLNTTDAISDGIYYVEQNIVSGIETLGSGFVNPGGVAIQTDGKIIIADTGNNVIKRMNANGTNIETLASGFNSPFGLAIQTDGKILIADYGNNAIKRMNTDGTNIQTLGSGFNNPFGVTIQTDNKILIADYGNNNIKRMDSDGNNIIGLGSIYSPSGVAIEADGKILAIDYSAGDIKRMNADGSNIATLSSGFILPSAIAIQADGKILVADFDNGSIKRMNADGSNLVNLGSGFIDPKGVAIQSDGKIVVADRGNNAIKRITEAATSNRVAVQVTTTTTLATHLDFADDNDYIPLTHFEKPNEFTIEAWVKNDYDTGNIICWYKNNETSHTKLRVDDGDVDFYIYDFVSDNSNTISSSITINSNWHHIAVVKNAVATDNLKIYVDGVLGATGTVNVNITSDNLMIGGRAYGTVAPFELFKGSLDELRIWNIARTTTEINATKDCELVGNESGLLAYYTFNQGYAQANNTTVTTLNNSVFGGSTGVLNNFNLYGNTSNWVSGSPIASGVTCTSLSNNSFTNSNVFSVYPNPSSGIFNIDTNQDQKIRVFDVLGKEMVLKNNNSKIIDITNYPNGIYYLEITSLDGEHSLHKLIKK